jgi:hypothetical protein
LPNKGRDRKLEGSSCRDLSVPEKKGRGIKEKRYCESKKKKTMYETYSSRKRESSMAGIPKENRINQTVFFREMPKKGRRNGKGDMSR